MRTVILLTTLLLAIPVQAERPSIGGGGRLPIPPAGRVDRDRWGEGGYTTYNYPTESETARAQRIEAEEERARRQQEADRRRSIDSHNDPGGGFFTDDQNPSRMFDE